MRFLHLHRLKAFMGFDDFLVNVDRIESFFPIELGTRIVFPGLAADGDYNTIDVRESYLLIIQKIKAVI